MRILLPQQLVQSTLSPPVGTCCASNTPPSLFHDILLSFTAATTVSTAATAAQLGIMPTGIPTLLVACTATASPTSSTITPASSAMASEASNPKSTAALALMLNAITGSTPQSTLAGDRVFLGHGLPKVPKSLLEKIQRWELIDLVELLPAPTLHDELASTPAKLTLFPGCELVCPKRRQIESILEWIKAFTVYMAALLQKYPAQANELLAYQLTI